MADAASTTQNLDALHDLAGNPWLGAIGLALFLMGLGLDVRFLVRFFRKRHEVGAVSPFQITPKPWGFGELGLIISAICVLLLFASLVLAWLQRNSILSGDSFDLARLFASGITFNGLGIAATFLLLHTARVSTRDAFGIHLRSWGPALGKAILFLIATLPPVWLAAALSQLVCTYFHLSTEPQDMAQLFLETDSLAIRGGIAFMAIVAAPLFEEMLFRGLAYPVLKEKFGLVAALVLTSLVFGAIHFHALSFAPLCVLALGLALAYEVSNDLAVPILMHGVFNLMTIVVMVMVRA